MPGTSMFIPNDLENGRFVAGKFGEGRFASGNLEKAASRQEIWRRPLRVQDSSSGVADLFVNLRPAIGDVIGQFGRDLKLIGPEPDGRAFRVSAAENVAFPIAHN